MNIVIFGLSISSAWGNGHATLLRGLFRALHGLGHEVHFFERDAAYYAAHRDAVSFPFANLHLYSDWQENLERAQAALSNADVGVVTSYCPDGAAACDLVLKSGLGRTVFYDMDTPVTLSRLDRGEPVPYLPDEGLAGFDIVLSYTGGQALEQLRQPAGRALRLDLVWLGRSGDTLPRRTERQVRSRPFLSRYLFRRSAVRVGGTTYYSRPLFGEASVRDCGRYVSESRNVAG